MLAGGIALAGWFNLWFGMVACFIAVLELAGIWIGERTSAPTIRVYSWLKNGLYAALVAFFLSRAWMPLGVQVSLLANFLFIAVIIAGLMLLFFTIIR
ncbi:hypothetical protein RZS08_37320, partial [Arthrospira platensis SPKY1]|nr:hypothetical protein [Arthrospira platensis SPKY1]